MKVLKVVILHFYRFLYVLKMILAKFEIDLTSQSHVLETESSKISIFSKFRRFPKSFKLNETLQSDKVLVGDSEFTII